MVMTAMSGGVGISAAGRIFDAAAALVLGRDLASFEGQGPMELEQAAERGLHEFRDGSTGTGRFLLQLDHHVVIDVQGGLHMGKHIICMVSRRFFGRAFGKRDERAAPTLRQSAPGWSGG